MEEREIFIQRNWNTGNIDIWVKENYPNRGTLHYDGEKVVKVEYEGCALSKECKPYISIPEDGLFKLITKELIRYANESGVGLESESLAKGQLIESKENNKFLQEAVMIIIKKAND